MAQKFTNLTQEAISDAIQSASAMGNAQISDLHLFDALLRQTEGVVRPLLQAVGADPQAIGADVRRALADLPSASGTTTSQPDASRQLQTVLVQAEKEMKAMGDEYVSADHLLIALCDTDSQSAQILKKAGADAKKLREAVPEVRGGKKITSADAEGSACNRFTYSYAPKNGLGHFLHTYVCDGSPIPTFQGEPERIAVCDDIAEMTDRIWNALNGENKISLYVRYIDLKTGDTEDRLVNKHR